MARAHPPHSEDRADNSAPQQRVKFPTASETTDGPPINVTCLVPDASMSASIPAGMHFNGTTYIGADFAPANAAPANASAKPDPVARNVRLAVGYAALLIS